MYQLKEKQTTYVKQTSVKGIQDFFEEKHRISYAVPFKQKISQPIIQYASWASAGLTDELKDRLWAIIRHKEQFCVLNKINSPTNDWRNLNVDKGFDLVGAMKAFLKKEAQDTIDIYTMGEHEDGQHDDYEDYSSEALAEAYDNDKEKIALCMSVYQNKAEALHHIIPRNKIKALYEAMSPKQREHYILPLENLRNDEFNKTQMDRILYSLRFNLVMGPKETERTDDPHQSFDEWHNSKARSLHMIENNIDCFLEQKKMSDEEGKEKLLTTIFEEFQQMQSFYPDMEISPYNWKHDMGSRYQKFKKQIK